VTKPTVKHLKFRNSVHFVTSGET